ncbi:unnamed protein product [Brassica oleracea]
MDMILNGHGHSLSTDKLICGNGHGLAHLAALHPEAIASPSSLYRQPSPLVQGSTCFVDLDYFIKRMHGDTYTAVGNQNRAIEVD